MSHALATVLHRGRKAASNVMAACLASSREARVEGVAWAACLASAWRPLARKLLLQPALEELSQRAQ